MENIALLLEKIIFSPSTNNKIKILVEFLKSTSNQIEKGNTIAFLTNKIKFKGVKSNLIKNIVKKKTDPYLFDISYDYVGDLAETIALIWEKKKYSKEIFSFTKIIKEFENNKNNHEENIIKILDNSEVNTRWAFIKLLLGGSLRIGMSDHLVKRALAIYGDKSISQIEMIWNGMSPPYKDLFSWLDNKAPIPKVKNNEIFHSLLLAQSISLKEIEKINLKEYFAEYKWDGIRVQIVTEKNETKVYSRSGEEITNSFPEIKINSNKLNVLDGELLVKKEENILSFNILQKRLNKKKPSKSLLLTSPAYIKLYDILFLNDTDLRNKNQLIRKRSLVTWYKKNNYSFLGLSDVIFFKNISEIKKIYSDLDKNEIIEGLMFKNKKAFYSAGRKKNIWYKLKKNPKVIDAILIYAQRGHGKRSSYYSDYTFGIWNNKKVVPIAKAYSGYTNEELEKIDKFVRTNVVTSFGPVKEVKKKLVMELAFDSIHKSKRHKSGLALRFPRINKIRWDKPINEVLELKQLKAEFNLLD